MLVAIFLCYSGDSYSLSSYGICPKGKKALLRMQFCNWPNLILDCSATISGRSLARKVGEGEAALNGSLVQDRVQFHRFLKLKCTDE